MRRVLRWLAERRRTRTGARRPRRGGRRAACRRTVPVSGRRRPHAHDARAVAGPCEWGRRGPRMPLECASVAPVAQPDRVVASEAIGRGFESLRARHPTPCMPILSGIARVLSAICAGSSLLFRFRRPAAVRTHALLAAGRCGADASCPRDPDLVPALGQRPIRSQKHGARRALLEPSARCPSRAPGVVLAAVRGMGACVFGDGTCAGTHGTRCCATS